jgi:excisionase family DNA binding protein
LDVLRHFHNHKQLSIIKLNSGNENMEELLTLKQTAQILKVNEQTLRRWDKEGRLKAVRIGSRRGVGDRRYRMEDIRKIVFNHGH